MSNLIGECILDQPCSLHVSAYVLPDRVMMILLNRGAAGQISFSADVAQWLPSNSGEYRVRCYDESRYRVIKHFNKGQVGGSDAKACGKRDGRV